MNMTELKEQIIAANKAYRIGRPIMSDIEFDNLCDQYEAQVSPEEWAEFRNSLHEETGKVKHPFVMGSLDKLKIEEPEKIGDWIRKYNIEKLHVSAKIDGISCRIHYNAHGEFESATTRGDGWNGQDITDKVKYVNWVPKDICYSEVFSKPFDVRGELVITDEYFAPLAETLKNPRNAAAGIMGQKFADPEMLKHVTFIAYEIMGGEIEKGDQMKCLYDMGFLIVDYGTLNAKEELEMGTLFESLEKWIRADFGYPTDGIVVSDVHYKAEDVYRPKAQKAIKISNLLSAKSTLWDVVWENPSKNGRITPVGIIEPVDIGGATISRVTLNNIDWIHQMGLRIGSDIEIVRSNGVIPKIIKVESEGSEDIQLPEACPVCGSPLKMVGVDICCKNPGCGATGIARVLTFLRNLDIKHVSLKTLENLGITDFEKLIAFKADKNYKVQTRFENDLRNQMWTLSDVKLFKALPFRNVAEKTLDKIIDFYGWDWLRYMFPYRAERFWEDKDGFPAGCGEKIMESFTESAVDNFIILDKFLNDSRWTGKKFDQEEAKMQKELMDRFFGSVCFTGKLENFSRKEAAAFAEKHGFTVLSGVSNGLSYLVTNDKDSGSSKNKKAAQLGVKVISEQEFIDLCQKG